MIQSPKELTYIDVGRLIHLDISECECFETGTVGRYDVLETTEGTTYYKAPQGITKYYKVLLRTATNYYVQSTTPYHEVSTTTHQESTTQYSPSIPPYYKVLLRTTKYYQCILHGKIQHFALRRSPRNLNHMLSESDSPTSPNVASATKNVIVSFLDCYFTAPFLSGLLHFSTIAFLS